MINTKEIESVLKLDSFKRYKYALKKIADLEELWVLRNESGDIPISEIDDNILLSIWSNKEYAGMCQQEDWKEYRPTSIDLDELENSLLPFISKQNYLIDVFPLTEQTGFVVDISEFTRDLNDELENY